MLVCDGVEQKLYSSRFGNCFPDVRIRAGGINSTVCRKSCAPTFNGRGRVEDLFGALHSEIERAPSVIPTEPPHHHCRGQFLL